MDEGSRGCIGNGPRRVAGGCSGCFGCGVCELVAGVGGHRSWAFLQPVLHCLPFLHAPWIRKVSCLASQISLHLEKCVLIVRGQENGNCWSWGTFALCPPKEILVYHSSSEPAGWKMMVRQARSFVVVADGSFRGVSDCWLLVGFGCLGI